MYNPLLTIVGAISEAMPYRPPQARLRTHDLRDRTGLRTLNSASPGGSVLLQTILYLADKKADASSILCGHEVSSQVLGETHLETSHSQGPQRRPMDGSSAHLLQQLMADNTNVCRLTYPHQGQHGRRRGIITPQDHHVLSAPAFPSARSHIPSHIPNTPIFEQLDVLRRKRRAACGSLSECATGSPA